MSSQVFEIHELVTAICEAVIVYVPDLESSHFGLYFYWTSSLVLKTLASLARVNRFVGSIALAVLWREPINNFEPFLGLFPGDYFATTPARGRSKKVSSSDIGVI